MARFLYHEACPKCNSRDNLARYDDGSAHCFGCSHYERPTKMNLLTYEDKKDPKCPILDSAIPEKNMDYLLKYLKPEEVKRWFLYSPSENMHVFMHMGEDGEIYWEGRGVDPKRIKSGGSKPFKIFGNSPTVVIVEDVISAIKVSRQFAAVPLWGSHLRADWIAKLWREDGVQRLVYWLDKDKASQAVRMLSKTSFALATGLIISEKDPKDYNDQEIHMMVTNVFKNIP